MKPLFFGIIVSSVTLIAGAQTLSAPEMNVLADSVIQGDLTQLSGHVRIAACSIVTADAAVIHPATHDVDLSGAVHMRLTNGIDPLR